MKYLILLFAVLISSCQQPQPQTDDTISDNVIYGADNRRDYYQERNKTVVKNMMPVLMNTIQCRMND
jgi:hypothetical protein